MVSLRKVVNTKILFRIRIRIRIMILHWISISDLHFIRYTEDTHQILFGYANSFESYCVHSTSPRRARHTDGQTDRQTETQADRQMEIFFCLFSLLRRTKHEHSSKGENFCFSLMRLQYFLFLHTPYVMRK